MKERRTSVPSDAAQLPALFRFVQDFWTEFILPANQAHTFELALEEVFMNVVMHGSDTSQVPRVEVILSLVDCKVTLTVEDDGTPFDPLSLPAPDVTAGLEGRRVGGLGVFLVRRVMDNVGYHRRGARNQLRMTKSLVVSGESRV